MGDFLARVRDQEWRGPPRRVTRPRCVGAAWGWGGVAFLGRYELHVCGWDSGKCPGGGQGSISEQMMDPLLSIKQGHGAVNQMWF